MSGNAHTRRKARRAAWRQHQQAFATRVKVCIEMLPAIWWLPL